MRTAEFRSGVRTDGLASADAVGSFMKNLRTWLDHLHVEPADFVPVRLGDRHLAFDVHFRQKGQATPFRQAFCIREIESSAELPQAA
jgi:hypothetical protein